MKFTQKVDVSFLREVANDSCDTRVHFARDGC